MSAAYLSWFAGKRVFVTGHTGFKGAWLSLWLRSLGAEVTGYALAAATGSLFDAAGVESVIASVEGDVRDAEKLAAAITQAKPDVVIHMAAQSLVRPSYDDPVGTFAINVVGTATLLDVVRTRCSGAATVVVTSDKCYENSGEAGAFSESARMGGSDPYSASKGCAELVTAAYTRSYFAERRGRLASARAGNVIGGGDWAVDRLMPDLMRAAQTGIPVSIRRPFAVRPWQHVLEPLRGYLMLAHRAATDATFSGGGWNFGPRPEDAIRVREIVSRVQSRWSRASATFGADREGPAEADALHLDCTKARDELGWSPVLTLDDAIAMTVDWYQATAGGADRRALTLQQIEDYEMLLDEQRV